MTAGNLTSEQMKTEFPLYPYQPNTLIPIIAAGVFGFAALYHFLVSIGKSAFGYWWAFLLGLIAETVGYVFRHLSAEKPTGTNNLWLYATSMLCIVLAPAFLAASLYASYGRIIRYVGPEYSPIKRVTGLFVTTDVLSIMVQAAGSAMFTSTDEDTVKLAKIILLVGFIIQLVAFSCFLLISVCFFFKAMRHQVPTHKWCWAIFALWGACVFILIRSVYRTLEFATGSSHDGQQSGYILTHENIFWIFEFGMITAATVVVSIGHPSYFLPRDKHATLQALPMSAWKLGYGYDY